jgi:hypothetical protein
MTTMIATDNKIVERCFLMNLDRRGDRLRDWMKQLPQPWPFPQPERFAAVDGRHIATPPQWRAGNGAWGCYRSHCLILEKCLLEGIDSYVVFEDDAGFGEDFRERLQEYVNELPADWGLAYLGGQHLYAGKHPPHKVSERVYRPYNVNRTHAFMVRGRDNMKALYRHLHWNDWHTKHHIDHHLGRLAQRRYRPSQTSAVASGVKRGSSMTPRTPITPTPRSSRFSDRIAPAHPASPWSCITSVSTWAINSAATKQPVAARRLGSLNSARRRCASQP